ncbi:hypothetical protein FA95DRAFT_1611445 [Auriscalpium vulgare]|uniref:Uncharacterized protein n=1 Tax=Auriscalpium vulgare TaxID=40419 RepID=A0ACB8RBB7_9AGAM|nr:hypothetical protein FA95DRAFT_1611445 [Auriscalpium vulgare]
MVGNSPNDRSRSVLRKLKDTITDIFTSDPSRSRSRQRSYSRSGRRSSSNDYKHRSSSRHPSSSRQRSSSRHRASGQRSSSAHYTSRRRTNSTPAPPTYRTPVQPIMYSHSTSATPFPSYNPPPNVSQQYLYAGGYGQMTSHNSSPNRSPGRSRQSSMHPSPGHSPSGSYSGQHVYQPTRTQPIPIPAYDRRQRSHSTSYGGHSQPQQAMYQQSRPPTSQLPTSQLPYGGFYSNGSSPNRSPSYSQKPLGYNASPTYLHPGGHHGRSTSFDSRVPWGGAHQPTAPQQGSDSYMRGEGTRSRKSSLKNPVDMRLNPKFVVGFTPSTKSK